MKILRITRALIVFISIVFGTTSCVVLVRKDNGAHRGWYKNTNNPHHFNSTNPGRSKHHNK